jgi:hypothetical protein
MVNVMLSLQKYITFRLRWLILFILALAICIVVLIIFWPRSDIVTFKDKFKDGIKRGWMPKTPGKWELAEEGKNGFYRLKEPGEYTDGIMRPLEYSLVSHIVYTDFTFKCKIRCDAPVERRYRDVVIIFGYQDDTHFYYVHFSNINDDLHNGIMLVNGDYRRKLNLDMEKPTLMDMEFHKVKVKRETETGKIEVYFDGKQVMEAQDATFTEGKVGIGSFDDMGSFDDVWVKGRIVQ